ncbi:TIM21-domain-containing protein [Saccharata proteae CBS 121410]|uniref:Mitochondrial import inner membrane translocase subunit Tim21 n=1 Tax=Saccharata proteae CBS 121410 TaxID=1314787 RepID=A0A9P4HYL9_9PEZI|nr:TIM21-domain-containing protein [Saccharata proteae CBS 121410]
MTAWLQKAARASPAESSSLCAIAAQSFPALRTSRRRYATHSSLGKTPGSSTSRRKQITIANDDGRVRWTDLSTREKVSRSTQQSFNFAVVAVGLLATGAVTYFIYHEIISPEGTTNQFARAVDKIKNDEKCVELLGDKKKIKAYGEPSWNRWQRNRPIASRVEKDKVGTEHMRIHFYVEGPLNSGVVNLHMTKRPDEDEFEYETLAVDIKGHSRIYLEKPASRSGPKKSGKIFGIRFW